MRKLLFILIMLVFSVVFLVGCGGVIPEPPPEIPLELIREYTGHDYVERWADGIVSVYDETNCEWTKDILDEINVAIGGPVVFKLSEDSNSQIKIIFKELAGNGEVEIDVESNDQYEIFNVNIRIDPLLGVNQPIYMCVLLVAVGIDIEKWFDGLTQEMKTVIYWLYQLPPGTSLM